MTPFILLKFKRLCHADMQWTTALPLVLFGIRTAFKTDLQASIAELVYGETLRIPGELQPKCSPQYRLLGVTWVACGLFPWRCPQDVSNVHMASFFRV
jgi:hypothetical protein